MDQSPPPPQQPESVRREVLSQTVTLLLGGLSLVAALAWNDAILSLFNHIFPKAGGLIAKFVYAAIVTAIIVIISMRLRKLKPSSPPPTH